MTIVAHIRLQQTVTESVTLTSGLAASVAASVVHDKANVSKNLGAATTPPATKVSAREITIAGGGGTIDLTDLPGIDGQDPIDGTGLKVQGALFVAADDNADPIVIVPGALNPYALQGATWAGLELEPGDADQCFKRDSAPDVAPGAKEIDYSGTDGDKLKVSLVLG